jgi:hypothetical protein
MSRCGAPIRVTRWFLQIAWKRPPGKDRLEISTREIFQRLFVPRKSNRSSFEIPDASDWTSSLPFPGHYFPAPIVDEFEQHQLFQRPLGDRRFQTLARSFRPATGKKAASTLSFRQLPGGMQRGRSRKALTQRADLQFCDSRIVVQIGWIAHRSK